MSKPILAICHAKHMLRFMMQAKLNYMVVLQRMRAIMKMLFMLLKKLSKYTPRMTKKNILQILVVKY